MAKHIFKGQGVPTFAPRQVGHHYVDLTTGDQYLSKGYSAPSDWVLLSTGQDKFVKIAATDTTPGYLMSKLVAGTAITLLEQNIGGNETLLISATGAAFTDEKVKVSATDTTPGYLNSEVVAGTGLTKTILNPAADEQLEIKIANTTVTAAAYGSATQVPSYTVNAQGQLTAAVNVPIAIPSTQVTDFTEAAQDAVGSVLTDSSTIDFTYNDAGNTITAAVIQSGLAFGTPVTQNPDVANTAGISTNIARADHVHNIPADAPTITLSPATTNAEGVGTSFARNDHTHAIATALAADLSAINPDDGPNAGVLNNFARGDHQHPIATVAPVDIGSANAEGVATDFVRSDHIHKGLRSVKANAGTQRFGDVSLVNGTGVTITDDGSGNFTINASASGGTLKTKAGTVAAASFVGSPRKFTVTFSTPFPNASYAINITGADNRNWTWESKLAGSFIINSNANTALAGNVDWTAIATGEST